MIWILKTSKGLHLCILRNALQSLTPHFHLHSHMKKKKEAGLSHRAQRACTPGADLDSCLKDINTRSVKARDGTTNPDQTFPTSHLLLWEFNISSGKRWSHRNASAVHWFSLLVASWPLQDLFIGRVTTSSITFNLTVLFGSPVAF